ncbi:hypothetical protein CPB85DRAFT_1261318 [Mucidula mucida]|nr:hypothetical protein CPB85DRAFT_1261318 [Mucidula mucida]
MYVIILIQCGGGEGLAMSGSISMSVALSSEASQLSAHVDKVSPGMLSSIKISTDQLSLGASLGVWRRVPSSSDGEERWLNDFDSNRSEYFTAGVPDLSPPDLGPLRLFFVRPHVLGTLGSVENEPKTFGSVDPERFCNLSTSVVGVKKGCGSIVASKDHPEYRGARSALRLSSDSFLQFCENGTVVVDVERRCKMRSHLPLTRGIERRSECFGSDYVAGIIKLIFYEELFCVGDHPKSFEGSALVNVEQSIWDTWRSWTNRHDRGKSAGACRANLSVFRVPFLTTCRIFVTSLTTTARFVAQKEEHHDSGRVKLGRHTVVVRFQSDPLDHRSLSFLARRRCIWSIQLRSDVGHTHTRPFPPGQLATLAY